MITLQYPSQLGTQLVSLDIFFKMPLASHRTCFRINISCVTVLALACHVLSDVKCVRALEHLCLFDEVLI